jgi:hypothetical protein
MIRRTAKEIADLLIPNCEQLFIQIVPDARELGGELRGHGPDGGKWTMRLRGDSRGVFCNWSNPEQRGDTLELVRWGYFPNDSDKKRAIAWALRWLRLDHAVDGEDAKELLAVRRAATETKIRRAEQEAVRRERRRRHALAIYLDQGRSVPVPLCPEIPSYLNGRGIPFGDLPWKPETLRFTPNAWHDQLRPCVPAMLAPIVDPLERKHIGTHVTYIEHINGCWRNTRLELRRRTFGEKKGGVIPLMRGQSRQPLATAPDGDTVLIAEGIENALAAALLCPSLPQFPDNPRVWAAVDVGNLISIHLPPQIRSVVLVHDDDGEKTGPRKHREQATTQWLKAGLLVQQMKPPEGWKDFNDHLAWLVAGGLRVVGCAS